MKIHGDRSNLWPGISQQAAAVDIQFYVTATWGVRYTSRTS
jgi:hypothetical protein